MVGQFPFWSQFSLIFFFVDFVYLLSSYLPDLVYCLDVVWKIVRNDAYQSNASGWWRICLHSIWEVDPPMRRNSVWAHLE